MLRSVRSTLLKSSATGLASGLACCLLFAAAHADVYKYKDEKGNVLYTDKPMFLPAERITVKTDAKDIVDLDKRDDEPAAKTSAAKPAPSAAKKSNEPPSASKEESCNKARQDYLTRMNAQRLFEEQPNGERRYLNEKELETARATAKQAMDTVCN